MQLYDTSLMCANKQVATFIKYSLGNSSSLRIFQKKARLTKFRFTAKKSFWLAKHFFAPNSSIFWKSRGKEEEDGEN